MKLEIDKEKLQEIQLAEKDDHKHTILIVDDEIANLESLKMVLGQSYNVLTAGNGLEALAMVKNHPKPEMIHLILSDQRMPEMSGVEFLKETIPIIPNAIRIILTGFTDIDAIISAINEGKIYKFLTKPIELNDLEMTVQRGLEAYELEMKNVKLAEELKILNNDLEKRITNKTNELKEALETIEEDLIVAEEVQKYVFPADNFPPFLKVVTQYLPLSYVSGDIYYFSNGHDGIFNVFIGDATGHGVSAALSTIMARMLLIDVEKNNSLAEIMESLNRKFANLLPENRFMTGIYLRISSQGMLTFCNAGHVPLIVLPRNKNEAAVLRQRHIPLGAFLDEHYEEDTYQLEPGDKIFLLTDGLTEALNVNNQPFGIPNICSVLLEHRELELKAIIDILLEKVKEHTKDIPFHDDVTIVVLEYGMD